MDDTVLVRLVQRLGQARGDSQRLRPVYPRTVRGHALRVRPSKVLEGDAERARLIVAAGVVHNEDGGMG